MTLCSSRSGHNGDRQPCLFHDHLSSIGVSRPDLGSSERSPSLCLLDNPFHGSPLPGRPSSSPTGALRAHYGFAPQQVHMHLRPSFMQATRRLVAHAHTLVQAPHTKRLVTLHEHGPVLSVCLHQHQHQTPGSHRCGAIFDTPCLICTSGWSVAWGGVWWEERRSRGGGERRSGRREEEGRGRGGMGESPALVRPVATGGGIIEPVWIHGRTRTPSGRTFALTCAITIPTPAPGPSGNSIRHLERVSRS